MIKKNIFYVPTFTIGRFFQANSEVSNKKNETYDHRLASFELARKAGVKIANGSDFLNGFPDKFSTEQQFMVEAGMTPMQTICSSTSIAAECIGLENKTGAIKKGLDADLIIIDSNPLEDITILQDLGRIKLVMKQGEVCVDRLRQKK